MMKRLLTILCIPALILLSSTEVLSLPPCEGSYNATTWTNCFGTITYPDGRKYVGEFKDGKWHGQGTFTFADGGVLKGMFRDGEIGRASCRERV